MPVDHELPRDSLEAADNRRLTAAYRYWVEEEGSGGGGGAAAAWRYVDVEYAGGAQYVVRVAPQMIGVCEAAVWLGGEEVGSGIRLSVVCPTGLVVAAGGLSCGCPAGRYMPDDGSQQCLSCVQGSWSDIGGECKLCAAAFCSPSTRACACLHCRCTFVSTPEYAPAGAPPAIARAGHHRTFARRAQWAASLPQRVRRAASRALPARMP